MQGFSPQMGFLSEGFGGPFLFPKRKGPPPSPTIDYGSSMPMITMPTAATAMEA